eukprot:TRINITY_DN1521_c0_g2_i1.p1 TRINITY_DN1521_c0_g2~~TRINITY_DN1521_c0_g2_i1.p1  ORF type:complete len:1276 (+),score=244.07 TRINITY_DN1521_c0_g2_i1:218-3829(+)
MDPDMDGGSFTRDCLPPVMDHEMEFVIKDALSFNSGEKIRSEPMVVRNFRFRILCFPAGTVSAAGATVSAFVEADPPEGLDPRWVFQSVKYQVVVVNWQDYRNSVVKTDTWNFSKEGIDRGWHDMVKCADLSQESGWLGPDNSLLIRACCCVRQADSILSGSDYNSRKETGYVGLLNHGATCYMNGLLQSLFHVGDFRRIVYSIESDKSEESAELKDGDDAGDPTLTQALQKVFYNLQTSESAVNCKELMKSFGWDTTDAFTQHDAQELNRILCDRLEEQMKGTDQDGSIKRLFEGEMENYIECLDVDYTSKRTETFYDIQLNIKSEKGHDLHNIEESLREFTADEMLDGDNLYEAEGYGKQRAKKGIRFLRFPPVVNLQLKRFHFDMERMDMVKLNSNFEIPRRLDLSRHAPGAGMYLLHSVMVHSGDVNSGHYYAYINPNLDGNWVKFDDDNITPCSEYAAVEDNFGGFDLNVWDYFTHRSSDGRNAEPAKRPRIHNAYILVYIREDSAADVLRTPDPMEVNRRMVERCNADVRLAEQRRREKLESQTKIRINLVFEHHLMSMPGFWDFARIPAGHSVKMNRDQTAQEVIMTAESVLDVARVNLVCFVLHHRSSNRQVRFSHMSPTSLLTNHIPPAGGAHFESNDPCLTVLCVAAKGFEPTLPPLKWKGGDSPRDELARWNDVDIMMLIVKYFCRQTGKLITLGCYYLPNTDPLIEMIREGWVTERLRPHMDAGEIAPLPPQLEDSKSDTLWDCWEEVNEREMQQRNIKVRAKQERLMSGDIIVWQQTAPQTEKEISLKPGEVAPIYPVNTVADLAEHHQNAIDVNVTLHDRRQPLFIDGVVMNGNYGPNRPATAAQDAKTKDGAAAKQETQEEIALSLSPVKFDMPVSKELQMDLRWMQVHVTGFVAQELNLKQVQTPANPVVDGSESFLWLFNSAPSSGQGEEPLNSVPSRTSLKDIQRAAPYVSPVGGKKPLNLHVVEMPFRPGPDGLDSGFVAIGVRFFDSMVREVGSEVLVLNVAGTVQDLLQQASGMIQADWGISGPLCALEVADGRVHKQHRPSDPLRSLSCFGKSNILYHCVRVEADVDINSVDETRLIEVYHLDRSSQQAFGHPLLIQASPGEKASSLKARCKDRLQVPEAEFKSWRLVRTGTRQGRVHLKDDEPWDTDFNADTSICLEHVHPNPTSSFARTSRYSKALTIK